MLRLRIKKTALVASPEVTDIALAPSSHLDTLEDGEVVGALTHNIPGESADWGISGNTKYRLSASSGVTVNLLRNGSSAFTAGVDETVTISAAVSGQAVPYEEVQTIGVTELGDVEFIQAFQVTNWGGSTSPGRHRKGLAFKKGDVPSTASVAIYRGSTLITAQFDNRNTWSDGSLKFCVASFIDTDFSAGETRDYDVMMVPSSSFSNTGTLLLSDITSNTDIKVELSSFTQYNGTTTTTRGDGTASIAFNTISATATRLTKRCSGAVYEEWEAWGSFVNGDTSTDDHLTGRGYIGVWKDENGDIADYDYAFVIKQDWWSIANKYRLNYTAVLKDGSTTIETYSTLQHPYNSRFATRYKGNDNNYCKRFSKTAMPTLFSTIDKAYWISTKLIPPYDTSFTPTSNTLLYGTYNWAPFSSMNHSNSLAATGAYLGRGMLPNCDAISFMRQTAADMAMSRKNADAGLHCPRHFSSNRTRTRPTESADTANTICPLILTPTYSGDFTADGLPVSVHAYRGGFSTYNDSYVSPLGGTGNWYELQDNAHLPNYCQYVYMIEGDNIMLDTMLSFAASNLQYNNGNEYSGRSKLWFFDVPDINVVNTISSVNWGSTVASQSQISNRAIGLSLLQRAVATGLCPDNHEQANYWDTVNEQSGEYFAASMVNLPADQEAAGFQGGGGNLTSPWMENIIALGAETNAAMTEDANMAALAEFKARVPVGCIDKAPALASAYRCAPQPTRSKWASGGTNNYFGIGEWFNEPVKAAVSSSVWSIATPLDNFNYSVANGDLVRFADTTNGNGGDTLARPAEVTNPATLYYVVNVSGSTFQLSTTEGGSAVTFASNANHWLSLRLAAYEDLTVFASPNLPNADSYAMINSAALIAAANRGDTAAQALLSKNATLCAPINKANWVSWHYQALA